MEFDFDKFLRESKENCKTKIDFVTRIEDEKTIVSKINDIKIYREKQAYMKRLDKAKLYTEHGMINEPDLHNEYLRKLLDGLK